MTLEIRREPPPNYAEVLAAFPAATAAGTYFCYGPVVWVPIGDANLSPALMAHESVHAERQGADPAGWWRRYIDDQDFRFEEELLAHIAEFAWFKDRPKPERKFQLDQIARRLSGPLYNFMVRYQVAKRLIVGKDVLVAAGD